MSYGGWNVEKQIYYYTDDKYLSRNYRFLSMHSQIQSIQLMITGELYMLVRAGRNCVILDEILRSYTDRNLL